jgi:hypothetical protein
VRSRAAVDKKLEISDEVGIGELVESGKKELDAESGLNQRGGSERAVTTGRKAANRNDRRRGPGWSLHGLHTYIHAHPEMAQDLSTAAG